MRSSALAAFAFLGFSVLLAPPGCGNRTIHSICQQSCTCKPCTDADFQACLDKGTAAEQLASKMSCSSQLDTFLGCLDDTLSCQTSVGISDATCRTVEQNLIKCSGSGNPFATLCQQAAQKSSDCSGSQSPGDVGDCPAISACQSACVLKEDCDVLLGMKFSQPFQDCINQCNTTSGGGGFGAAGPK